MCRAMGVARATVQDRPDPEDDDALRHVLIRLANWREEGLHLPERHQASANGTPPRDASLICLRPRPGSFASSPLHP